LKAQKKNNRIKFHRDLDSDWIVQEDIIHYGLKGHAAVDANHGFILATRLTPASVNDTNYLSYCILSTAVTPNNQLKKYTLTKDMPVNQTGISWL